jgi:hypothetical protein
VIEVMRNAPCLQHVPAADALAPVRWACLLLWLALCTPLASAAEAGGNAGERAAGGHRWLAPAFVSAPATSVLALAGVVGLAAHLFRRRRAEKRQTALHQRDDAAREADWQQRIAMWERRLRSGEADAAPQAQTEQPAGAGTQDTDPTDTAPPGHTAPPATAANKGRGRNA